jgi:pyrroline-5-carboxylate reductase
MPQIKTRLIFIGGGNMAEAIFAKLPQEIYEIIVIQRNYTKLNTLGSKYPHIKLYPSLEFNTLASDLVILAIKPQDAKLTCQSVAAKIVLSNIISVMAGIKSEVLQHWLNNSKIIRTMPNTPSSVNLGVTGIYSTPNVETQVIEQIKSIFECIGKVYCFIDENYIDKIIPVSGSAPAYVFYFVESMLECATTIFGFQEEMAREMIVQVLKGSCKMLEANPDTPVSTLRENVTSKKGTTEAALNVLIEHNFKQTIAEAENACFNRAQELNKLFT